MCARKEPTAGLGGAGKAGHTNTSRVSLTVTHTRVEYVEFLHLRTAKVRRCQDTERK